MVAIVDYGVGNLFSLTSSFHAIGAEVVVTSDPQILTKADKIILPGVGAFEDAAKKLRESKLDQVIIDLASNGKPLMGICLGMQMLFEKSYEYGSAYERRYSAGAENSPHRLESPDFQKRQPFV